MVALLLDNALTLGSQPPEYWAGNYTAAAEFSPHFYLLLKWHPLAFQTWVVLWIILLNVLIFRLPRDWAWCASLLVTLAHSIGASSWLVYHCGNWGFLLAAALILVMRSVFDASSRRHTRAMARATHTS